MAALYSKLLFPRTSSTLRRAALAAAARSLCPVLVAVAVAHRLSVCQASRAVALSLSKAAMWPRSGVDSASPSRRSADGQKSERHVAERGGVGRQVS